MITPNAAAGPHVLGVSCALSYQRPVTAEDVLVETHLLKQKHEVRVSFCAFWRKVEIFNSRTSKGGGKDVKWTPS